MLIYEYKCRDCGKVSEAFVRSLNSHNAQCPACGSHKLDRLLSTSYTLRTEASTPGMTCCGREERCEMPPCSSGNSCRRDKK